MRDFKEALASIVVLTAFAGCDVETLECEDGESCEAPLLSPDAEDDVDFGASSDLSGTPQAQALTDADCPAGGALYGESVGGFCCVGGSVNGGNCIGGDVCALDPARPQGNEMCHCPEGMDAFGTGNAYCCDGNVTGGGSSCDAGADAVCAKNPGDPYFAFCSECPDDWNRYGGNRCCDGPTDGDSCDGYAVCKMDASAPYDLPVCDPGCPEGTERYLGEYCCDGEVSDDGTWCQPHATDTLVCALETDGAFQNPRCSDTTCPDGSTLYAGGYCCDGTVGNGGNTCAGNVCALDANDPWGNPECGGGCPFGMEAYGNNSFCCDGTLTGDTICGPDEYDNPPVACALPSATQTWGLPACGDMKAPHCPDGMENYLDGFCCAGEVIDGQGCAPRPLVCTPTDNGSGNPVCASSCPEGMTPYGGGAYCCDGEVTPEGNCIANVVDCTLDPDDTSKPQCGATVVNGNTVTVERADGTWDITGSWASNSDGSLSVTNYVDITTPAGVIHMEVAPGSELKLTLDPFGISGTVKVPVPSIGGMGGMVEAITPEASVSLQLGSEFDNGEIKLGLEEDAESFPADPDHYYFVFAYDSTIGIASTAGDTTVEVTSDGSSGLVVLDPLEPMFFLEGDLPITIAGVPFGKLGGAFGFAAAGGLPFTPAREFWNEEMVLDGMGRNIPAQAFADPAGYVEPELDGHVYIAASGGLLNDAGTDKGRIQVDGRMILDVDANNNGLTWFEEGCGDFALGGDVGVTFDASLGEYFPLELRLAEASVILEGSAGGCNQPKVSFSAGTPGDGIFGDTLLDFIHPGDLNVYGYFRAADDFLIQAQASGDTTIAIGDMQVALDPGELTLLISHQMVKLMGSFNLPGVGSGYMEIVIDPNKAASVYLSFSDGTIVNLNADLSGGVLELPGVQQISGAVEDAFLAATGVADEVIAILEQPASSVALGGSCAAATQCAGHNLDSYQGGNLCCFNSNVQLVCTQKTQNFLGLWGCP